MSIFESNKTDAQKRADRVRLKIEAIYGYDVSRFQSLMEDVWGSDDPLAVIAALGVSDVEVFAWAEALQDVMQLVNPNYQRITPADYGWDVTRNEDGSIASAERIS